MRDEYDFNPAMNPAQNQAIYDAPAIIL